MKRHYFLLFFLFATLAVFAQNISVQSFRALPTDITASSLEGKRFDQNGQVAALIKVMTTETGFVFEGGALGIVNTQQRVGEIWVWVPRGLRKITILHQQLGGLRDYMFPVEIEAERTYEMVLTTGKVKTIVEDVPREQFLVFQITPPDAMLEVNDQVWTVSPEGMARRLMDFGTYSYRVQAANYHPEAGNVTVNDPNDKQTVTITLMPNFGWIEVKGNEVQNAAVYVDNAFIGKAPCKSEALKSGEHTVKIAREMYAPYTERVVVRDNETTTLSPTLTADFARVTLTVDADAEIWVNEERKGIGSWTGDLANGNYKMECRQANHETTVTRMEITNQMNGQVVRLDPPIPIYGSLVVESTPDMATLFIDGKEEGETPKIINKLIIGPHQLKLSKDGYYDHVETVTIVKGERKQVNVTLSNEDYYAKGKAYYDQCDFTRAFEQFTKGAQAGDANAQVMLGRMYYKGKGTEQDCEQARRWFQAAIDQNNGDAYAWMSDIYVEKNCGEVDYEKALELIRKSIDLGSAYGMNNLGYLYKNGFGVKQDYNEAVKWYRMSAEQGDPVGQTDLGYMYQNGIGITKDYNEAVKWYRQAAEKGHMSAQTNLGYMYFNGYGVKRNYEEAMKWYLKASEQGNTTAMINIGYFYEHGEGAKLDIKEAKKWYQKAADLGSESAKKKLKELK